MRETRADLSEAWRCHVEEILGPLPEGLLNPLEAIGGLAAEVRNIRALQVQGQRIAASLPDAGSVAEKLATAHSLTEQKRKKWERLSGGAIPDEVVRFLSRAASREACLADVSDTVWEWLATQNLLTWFRVMPN